VFVSTTPMALMTMLLQATSLEQAEGRQRTRRQPAQGQGQEPAQGQTQERALAPSRYDSPSLLNTRKWIAAGGTRTCEDRSVQRGSSAQLSGGRSSEAAAAEAKGAHQRHTGTGRRCSNLQMEECARVLPRSQTDRAGVAAGKRCRQWQQATRTEVRRGQKPMHRGDDQTRTYALHACSLLSLPVVVCRPPVRSCCCSLPLSARLSCLSLRCTDFARSALPVSQTHRQTPNRTQQHATQGKEHNRRRGGSGSTGWQRGIAGPAGVRLLGVRGGVGKVTRRWNSRRSQERKAINSSKKRCCCSVVAAELCVFLQRANRARLRTASARTNDEGRLTTRLGSLDGVHAHDVVGVTGCTNKKHNAAQMRSMSKRVRLPLVMHFACRDGVAR
jgi:hypothetical protein